jgi:hypothetical protein
MIVTLNLEANWNKQFDQLFGHDEISVVKILGSALLALIQILPALSESNNPISGTPLFACRHAEVCAGKPL